MEEEALSPFAQFITNTFGGPLKVIFDPINKFICLFYEPIATICAISLFVGTMIWVFVFLKKDYVNMDAPGKGILYDLRFWTIASMLPHVVVYFYFTE